MQTLQTTVLALATMLVLALPLAAQVAPPSNNPAPDSPAQEARITPEPKCWADWSEASIIVRREALLPVERISKLANAKYPGASIIKVTLCEEQGRFVYHLLLRERQGHLKSELLDAR
jgi:uncharacterized membrane protein YkoI